MGKSCKDYVSELNDFIDGELDPELCREIEKHIGKCENCRIMVDTMRQTVELCREGARESLPPALEARLSGLLKAHWDRKFGSKKD
jgi:anti-sigma factor RsiW